MLASQLLVALFALPAALAQSSEAPAGDAPAPTDAPAGTDAAPANTETAATTTKTKSSSVGADINNTGNGQSSGTTGNWTKVEFTAPSADYYWVVDVDNYAAWTPYQEPVNLVLFNSNKNVFKGNMTIAENIPAGTGNWKGKVQNVGVGNNYIIAVAPVSDPTRKVGQTAGFWIKSTGTYPMGAPAGSENSTTANSTATAPAGSSTSAAGTNSTGTATNGTVASPAGSNASVDGKSAASAIAISAGAVVAAAAVALAF